MEYTWRSSQSAEEKLTIDSFSLGATLGEVLCGFKPYRVDAIDGTGDRRRAGPKTCGFSLRKKQEPPVCFRQLSGKKSFMKPLYTSTIKDFECSDDGGSCIRYEYPERDNVLQFQDEFRRELTEECIPARCNGKKLDWLKDSWRRRDEV